MNGQQQTKSRWIFWLLGGCLLIVIVGVAAVAGLVYWGKKKVTTFVEEQTDPAKREQRTKELLGAQTLPPGYFAGVSLSIGLVRTAWLSDSPMSDENHYRERGFVFNESMRGGDAKPNIEKFVAGEHGNVIDEMSVRLRSDENLGSGKLEVNDQRLEYHARRGEVTHSNEAVPGVYSIVLIRCGDDRERWAAWFQRVPPSTPTADIPRAGSVIDEESIRAFFAHFHLCR